MKLLNYRINGCSFFGVAVGAHVLSFEFLQNRSGQRLEHLDGMDSYLQHLPESFENARRLHQTAQELVDGGKERDVSLLSDVKILPPVPRPAALLDFGLTPRHLALSSATMMKHEFGPWKGRLFASLLARRIYRKSRSDVLMYYKGNPLTVIGDDDEIGWPAYTSYLDIEPELALVAGNPTQPIAGYLIFNDASARDVQFPEMIGMGPARSKDFGRGNGLGPFLVTPDEIDDPLELEVTVQIGDRHTWRGHTSEYSAHPREVIGFCETIFPLAPGTVIGLGTVPGCTGLDNDLWPLPGERIRITFQGLGTLRQRMPSKLPPLSPSRWKARPELIPFQ